MELKTLLAGQPRDVKVEWMGEVVSVTFDPTAYTPKLEASLFSEAEGGSSQALVPFITELVTAWDIVEAGEPFPLNNESVATLPLGFLAAVIRTVASELAADPTLFGTSEEPS